MVNKFGYFILVSGFLLFSISCSSDINDPYTTEQITEEQQLKNAVAQYPDSLLLTEDLIEYYRNKGNYDTAIQVTGLAIQKDSLNVELWDVLGTLMYENGDTIQAINAFETVINIYPLPEYIISLGTLYAQTKNPKALLMADALLNADRANAKREALFIKGLYYSYISDKKKAIIFFDSCITKDYTYMFAYREKAIAMYEQENYEGAVNTLTRAVTIQNNFDEGYYWLGRCYEKLGNAAQAKENYQLALLYDKNFIEAKEALGRIAGK